MPEANNEKNELRSIIKNAKQLKKDLEKEIGEVSAEYELFFEPAVIEINRQQWKEANKHIKRLKVYVARIMRLHKRVLREVEDYRKAIINYYHQDLSKEIDKNIRELNVYAAWFTQQFSRWRGKFNLADLKKGSKLENEGKLKEFSEKWKGWIGELKLLTEKLDPNKYLKELSLSKSEDSYDYYKRLAFSHLEQELPKMKAGLESFLKHTNEQLKGTYTLAHKVDFIKNERNNQITCELNLLMIPKKGDEEYGYPDGEQTNTNIFLDIQVPNPTGKWMKKKDDFDKFIFSVRSERFIFRKQIYGEQDTIIDPLAFFPGAEHYKQENLHHVIEIFAASISEFIARWHEILEEKAQNLWAIYVEEKLKGKLEKSSIITDLGKALGHKMEYGLVSAGWYEGLRLEIKREGRNVIFKIEYPSLKAYSKESTVIITEPTYRGRIRPYLFLCKKVEFSGKHPRMWVEKMQTLVDKDLLKGIEIILKEYTPLKENVIPLR